MLQRILVTGGAGFIGSHVVDELLEAGYHVRVLDDLEPQIHGSGRRVPDYLSPSAEFLEGDVRDAAHVRSALEGVDAVLHLAAAVGVGQSMYQMAHYTSVNDFGTAVLLEALTEHPVARLVVASSMSIYGEGLYRDAAGHTVAPPLRPRAQLEQGDWEMRDGNGQQLEPIPTPETKQPEATSVYALSKFVQERLCLVFGEAYQIPTIGLRFFNVYGPRQALSNPYTGVLAIFSSRLLSGQPPLIFEDGRQQRDFVNVHDVARACRLALEADSVSGGVFNIGSGQPLTVCDVATNIATVLHREDIEPEILGRYRVGDIRHCFADISSARAQLGYEPLVTFEQGMIELAEWLMEQEAFEDGVVRAKDELLTRGLVL